MVRTLFLSFRVRVAWSSRPACSVVAGYASSHPFMVFNRVVSLLAVGLVVVGSLENSWFVGVIRLSCVWIEVHSSSTCCWHSRIRTIHTTPTMRSEAHSMPPEPNSRIRILYPNSRIRFASLRYLAPV